MPKLIVPNFRAKQKRYDNFFVSTGVTQSVTHIIESIKIVFNKGPDKEYTLRHLTELSITALKSKLRNIQLHKIIENSTLQLCRCEGANALPPPMVLFCFNVRTFGPNRVSRLVGLLKFTQSK